MGTLQVGGTTLGVKNTTTNKIDLSNTGTLDNLPFFACRAWVNFDGTKDTTGTSSSSNTNRLIRASGNVTSVLRNGAGDFTITFTTAMSDANYSVLGLSGRLSNLGERFMAILDISSNSCRIETLNASGVNFDCDINCIAIFR
jgi:hypothetical protein